MKKTLEQANNLDLHRRLYGEVVIMPDAHCGYGMPIGGVCYLQKEYIKIIHTFKPLGVLKGN